ncbi:Hydroxypyruvate isomerase [Botrimarina colliarenosi]|uniref:Hydroxypyruvate isomerase n=1 Tax=Botrimarina colliarenosi TaxID=2528001 RepID=A0A5C6ALS4_9BACT|nr:TIM barrel protein [Botrimarina colliarenosi]TWU00417.1 Hydroxypyruvate isomerase [Botrimarina colliarenosi]
MKRRDFLTAAGAAAAASTLSNAIAADDAAGDEPQPFKLGYAPHFGLFENFAGKDRVAQLEYAASVGFRDWEENQMASFPVEEQQRLADAMQRLNIRMGVFVAYGIGAFGKVSFTGSDKKLRDEAVEQVKASVEVAKRVNAKWMTVVPGAFNNGLEPGYQTAKCVDLLRRCAEVLEPHDLVMVLEPLNWWANHPGLFLNKIPQAYEICRAVDSPSCKILFDIYHQQIQEGNLIPNMAMAWDEIGYFQSGDNPGRNEPGTGEINYRNVFKYIHSKGFDGIIGMEHGKSLSGVEGDEALLAAYRAADDF